MIVSTVNGLKAALDQDDQNLVPSALKQIALPKMEQPTLTRSRRAKNTKAWNNHEKANLVAPGTNGWSWWPLQTKVRRHQLGVLRSARPKLIIPRYEWEKYTKFDGRTQVETLLNEVLFIKMESANKRSKFELNSECRIMYSQDEVDGTQKNHYIYKGLHPPKMTSSQLQPGNGPKFIKTLRNFNLPGR